MKVGSLVRYFQYPGDSLNGKLALIVEAIGKTRNSPHHTASKFYYKVYIDGRMLLIDRESLWALKEKKVEDD